MRRRPTQADVRGALQVLRRRSPRRLNGQEEGRPQEGAAATGRHTAEAGAAHHKEQGVRGPLQAEAESRARSR